jgi:hypothetical protein
VSPEEEAALLAEIDANADGWVALSKRRVQHYGFRRVALNGMQFTG